MQNLAVIGEFWERCENSTRIDDVAIAVYDVAEKLGFNYASYLCLAPSPDAQPVIRFANYPPAFLEHYRAERFDQFDPITRRACRTTAAFEWRDPLVLAEMTPTQLRLLDEARRHGWRNGYAVPLNSSMHIRAAFFFASHDPEIPIASRQAGRWVSTIAHEHIARIVRFGDQRRYSANLAPRERECLNLWASGFDDAGIANALTIRVPTVRRHLERAKIRLGVHTRAEALVRAILAGQVIDLRL